MTTSPPGSAGAGGFDAADITAKLVKVLGPGVVQAVLTQFNASGLGKEVNSWLGRGPNEPITADQIRTALGNEKVQEIAASLGIPADKLAELLPAAVDKASREGQLPPAGDASTPGTAAPDKPAAESPATPTVGGPKI